jgi:hypothetical protein
MNNATIAKLNVIESNELNLSVIPEDSTQIQLKVAYNEFTISNEGSLLTMLSLIIGLCLPNLLPLEFVVTVKQKFVRSGRVILLLRIEFNSATTPDLHYAHYD